MPENFASLLEALDAEGRTLVRPAPAAEIEARARGRRRRRRFSTAGSVLAVCAIAAGAAFGVGGTKADSQPVKPISSTPTPAPTTRPAQTPTPSPSGSSAHQASATGNRTGEDKLLLPAEAPQPALFQWTRTVFTPATSPTYTAPICALDQSGPPKKSRAQTSITAGYQAVYDNSSAQETIFHYGSPAAARADYAVLAPDPTTCPAVSTTATITDGVAWQDLAQGTSSLQRMIVLSGNDIAYWFYAYPGGNTVYNTAEDGLALQRMADRLAGRTPAPDPVTVAPPGTLPGTAWLDVSKIPFGTADQSHGWVGFGTQQQVLSDGPDKALCADIQDGYHFVGLYGATVTTRSYHGTPSTTPVYPGSNYLYSSADEHILTFPDGPAEAKMAFEWSNQITLAHGCQFKDGSGEQVTRKIKIGTVTPTGFSLVATDTPGPSYEHLYCVIKGAHVAWMVISFEQGDTSTAGDAAILAALAAPLP